MPVISINLKRLMKLLRAELLQEVIIEKIPYLGLDIEEATSSEIRVEYNPNRVDYSTDYGIARGLRGLLGIEEGCPTYQATESHVEIKVDRRVEDMRPFIVSAVIKGLDLDDESIRQIISMQEDIHNGVGRKRSKASIGIHNLDILKPPILYTTETSSYSFLPLEGERKMSIKEILEKTDVGKNYGWIVEGHGRYPVLKDASGEVFSFPPVINSNLTKVTSDVKNLLVEMTATDIRVAEDALAVIATTLHDAGGRIESVRITRDDKSIVTPALSPLELDLDKAQVNRLLGLSLSEEEMVGCLAKSRINVKLQENGLKTIVPRYRIDILHPVDLVEEVAIGYGLERFTPTLPRIYSVGRLHPTQKVLSNVRDTLTGLSLTEVMNFNLTSPEKLCSKVRRTVTNPLKVEAPKSSEVSVLRDWLISSLLDTISINIHSKYPQKIFEVGKAFFKDERFEGAVREEYHLAVAIAHASAGYTEINSIQRTLLKEVFNCKAKIIPTKHPTFIEGRAASIVHGEKPLGLIGEVHPEVLTAFDLRMPIAAFEINIQALL